MQCQIRKGNEVDKARAVSGSGGTGMIIDRSGETGMSTIDRYTVEGKQPELYPFPDMEWDEYRDAVAFAQEHHLRVICNEYEWSDSYLTDDFTRDSAELTSEESPDGLAPNGAAMP